MAGYGRVNLDVAVVLSIPPPSASPAPPRSVRVIGSVSVPLPPRAPPSPFLLGSRRTRFRSSCVSVSPLSELRLPLPSSSSSLSAKVLRSLDSLAYPRFCIVQFFILCARCRSLPVSIVDASVAALPLPLLPPSSSHLPSSRVSSSSLSPWPLSTCSSCPLLLVATPLASSLPLPPCPPRCLVLINGPLPPSPLSPSPSPCPVATARADCSASSNLAGRKARTRVKTVCGVL